MQISLLRADSEKDDVCSAGAPKPMRKRKGPAPWGEFCSLKASDGEGCCNSKHPHRQEKKKVLFARPAQGWTKQGCRKGWKPRWLPEELSRSVCFISEPLAGCEKLLVPKQEKKKAVGERHPAPHHSWSPQLFSPFIHICGLLFL